MDFLDGAPGWVLAIAVVGFVVIKSIPEITKFLNRSKEQENKAKQQETKAEYDEFRKWTERESNLIQFFIDLIKEYSEKSESVSVNLVKVATVLDSIIKYLDDGQKNCDACKNDQMKLWEKIDDKLGVVNKKLDDMSNQIEAGFDGQWAVLQRIDKNNIN